MVGKICLSQRLCQLFLEKGGGFKALSLLLKAPTLLLNFLVGVNTPRAQKKSRKKRLIKNVFFSRGEKVYESDVSP